MTEAQAPSADMSVEINGKQYPAKRGETIIQVADQNDVYIPRFCYHEKLSVVANCRMCLVEVANAPKAMPACATPVSDGMQVMTQSPKALSAQRAVMSFLLINHPLDCPVCDQGGACELQDLSMGFGQGKSDFTLPKRAVKDLDVGPLIQTHMTRCIHCTRCVRFGEEVAGMREMGATGRGEHMEIGTYVSKMIRSELSGNVIDLCPVGALTSKPFAFQARHWEMQQHPSVAMHDAVGSHVYLHTRGDAYHAGRTVMKVIPRYAPSLNQNWISDRDRYSYLGLQSDDRLLAPEMKIDGAWQHVSWSQALEHVASELSQLIAAEGPQQVAGLASAQCTTEALYSLQTWLRGLGCQNIDFRAKQRDFSDDHLPHSVSVDADAFEKLAQSDAVLLVGSCLRQEQPLLNVRLRQAALQGAKVMSLNMLACPANHALAHEAVVSMDAMVPALAYCVQACLGTSAVPAAVRGYADAVSQEAVVDVLKLMASVWQQAKRPVVIFGADADQHPQSALLRQLLALWHRHTGGTLWSLPLGANVAGARVAGMLPNHDVAGQSLTQVGDHASAMMQSPKRAYVLLNLEPEWDHSEPDVALKALRQAQCVVSCTPFASEAMRSYATVLLPIAPLGYEDGSITNLCGERQTVTALPSEHEAVRQAWQVFKDLANAMAVPGLSFEQPGAIAEHVQQQIEAATADQASSAGDVFAWPELSKTPLKANHWRCVVRTHMYQIDPLVRRSQPLQAVAAEDVRCLVLSPGSQARLGLGSDDQVMVSTGAHHWIMPYRVSDSLADDAVMFYCKPDVWGGVVSGAQVQLQRSAG